MKRFIMLAEWFVHRLGFVSLVIRETIGTRHRVVFALSSILPWTFTQFNTICVEMSLSKLSNVLI